MISRLIFFLMVFAASGASASPLVFQFTNPAFNSQSNSGDYLLGAAGINRGRGHRYGHSETPTYQILEINNGAIVLQNGEGNVSSIIIQSGNGNDAQTNQ